MDADPFSGGTGIVRYGRRTFSRKEARCSGRPYVDTVKGSAFPNMKELRTAHDKHLALRAFFAFDPKRSAILLIGGDKHGRRGFYDEVDSRSR